MFPIPTTPRGATWMPTATGSNVPGQGYVWSPYEAQNAGWDPYGCGSWMWTPGYGYIWVSCEPWGFMPYGYGMWSYFDGFGWGWNPGGGGWWGGHSGFVYNIGHAPYHYQPPQRPHGGPQLPVGAPVHVAGGKYQPYPVVSVNRFARHHARRSGQNPECSGSAGGEHRAASAPDSFAADV